MKIDNLVWDIEADGLLDTVDNIWMLCATDDDTGTEFTFSDHDKALPDMDYGLELLYNTKNHIGHNLFGYDFQALAMKYDFKLEDDVKVTDTWILSLLNCYKRSHNHGLKGWGEKLEYPKGDYNDWSHYNKQMLHYCKRDVELNRKVYHVLKKEALALIKRNPMYSKRIELEMYISRANMQMQKGWVYDKDLADLTIKEIDKKMKKVERAIEPKLGSKRVWIDKAPKTPKYTKKGLYNATTARLLTEYLGVPIRASDALLPNPPIKPNEHFQRFKTEKITMGQMDDVKTYLMEQEGWKPNEWNRSNKSGFWRNTSPKLEGANLEALGEVGKGVSEYYMLRHRKGFLEGFNTLNEKRGDDRINGGMWTIGTPTFRVRHEGIVNLPSNDPNVQYGKEIRSTLTVEHDRSVVGCDSAGNQLRGACHVMGNDEYTEIVINKDMHQYNADMVGCTRKMAKVFIYRILFGSKAYGLSKEFGVTEAEAQKMIDNFCENLPEFQETNERLEKEWHKNNGYIFGIMGNIIFVDEPRKALNSLLQDIEKASCVSAMYYAAKKMKEEGIDAYPLIFYHDEDAFAVKTEQAKRAGEILKEGFKKGPEMMGITIMDGGDPCIGRTYADVH
jgi:hypothetical protein